MTQRLVIHATHPQARRVRLAADALRRGGLIAYPTDSCYALGCHLGDAHALARLRQLRGIDGRHPLTLVCRDLSELATYAIVDNVQYRLLRNATPGPYVFILRGTREVPRRLLHPKRRSIGLRVPDHPVPRALLAELGAPMLSSTLQLAGERMPLADSDEIVVRAGHALDAVLDAGPCASEPTTVIDLSGETPVLMRRGRGSLAALGLALHE